MAWQVYGAAEEQASRSGLGVVRFSVRAGYCNSGLRDRRAARGSRADTTTDPQKAAEIKRWIDGVMFA